MNIGLTQALGWALLSLAATNPASGQDYWAKFQGGGNVDEALAVVSDASGNVYMTGYFSTSAEINDITLSVDGLTDVFVSKVDASGTELWSVAGGGAQSDRGLGIAVDGSGNVFVCGFFSGSADFGNGVSIAAAGGGQDAFLVKYNGSGVAQWARAGGSSSGADRANAVAVDGAGNVIVTGQFSGVAQFGGLSLSSTNGTNDVFTVKYAADGAEQWAKSGSGDALNRGLSIAVDNANSVYVAGQFSGDITFDNSYANTIQNALFLTKYDASGNEVWVRWAGGVSQSTAYGLVSDGSNVYVAGDCGSNLTFFGTSTNPQITADYNNAVFAAAYSGSGNFLWGSTQSSTSPVSARGLAIRGNTLALGGWYQCTLSTLSETYGEANFNSIGFRDAFVMRYNTSGNFVAARNFGSQSDEEVLGVTIAPDGEDVLVGSFEGDLVVPKSGAVSGLETINDGPNGSLTYCSDPNYGNFGVLHGSTNRDGFALKAIDYDRAPYDYYMRLGTGCNVDIPTACIVKGLPYALPECPTELSGCPPMQISAVNQTYFNVSENEPSIVGFDYNLTWSPTGTGVITYATNPGTYNVTMTSADGCYSQSASVEVVFDEIPPTPLMSDSEGVNDENLSTLPVFLCPGESVDLWATFPDGYDFVWSGIGLDPDQWDDEIVTVSETGTYQITISNASGCSSSNYIYVDYYPELPPEVQPYVEFHDAVNDTVTICTNVGTTITVMDSITGEPVIANAFSWLWTVSPNFAAIAGESQVEVSPSESGWYVFSIDFWFEPNPCLEDSVAYTVIDSVFFDLLALPQVFVDLNGPESVCFGDTITLFLDYSGSLSFDFTPIADFGDSLWVAGTGTYSVTVDSIDALNGCYNSATTDIAIGNAVSPEIFSNPAEAVICPGDSVELFTNAPGEITWQGPLGAVAGGQSLFVSEPGLYFAEVQFYPGCNLVSNTLQVVEYNTPFISGSNAVLCEGDSVVISVISPGVDDIQWLAPLSGSDTSQVITEPGTYMAEVTGCGITATVSIDVELSTDSLFIARPDSTYKCEGDSVLITATSGYSAYQWQPAGQGDSIYVHENATVQAAVVTEDGCHLESNILEVEFETTPPPPTFDYEPVCEGQDLQLTVPGPFQTIFTDGFGGPTIQTGPDVYLPNFVTDTVLYVYLSTDLCLGLADSLHLSPKPYPPVPIPATDAPVCTGTSLHLALLNDSTGTDYYWISPSGAHFSGGDTEYYVFDMGEAGVYSVYADLQGCVGDTAYIDVGLFDTQYVDLPPDTTACEQTGFILTPEGDFIHYEWQDGSADSVYLATETGNYFVLVTDPNGCESSDETFLTFFDCDVTVPNVFTPNGDGRNDSWLIGVSRPGYFEVVVYNRWGRLMYSGKDYLHAWDGVNQNTGKPCSEGVYFYIIRLRNLEGRDYELTGTLTLIRD